MLTPNLPVHAQQRRLRPVREPGVTGHVLHNNRTFSKLRRGSAVILELCNLVRGVVRPSPGQ